MATTPFFLWATQASSSSSAAAATDHDIGGLGATEVTAATEAAQLSPELAAAVARPRLRRQASAPAKPQQQQAGGSKKTPQRGLGVAELERLRCGGDPLRDLNVAVAAAAMGDAAANVVHGHSVIQHHLQVPTFDADTGGRHYAPLLVRSAPPPPPPAPFCYLHSSSAGGGQNVAPEQQFMRDRWGCMGSFAGVGHQPQLLPLAPEHPSSQSNTIWRPASSSCLHAGHRCDLCSKTMVRALVERGARGATTPGPVVAAAAAAAATTPDYSIYDLAAAMANSRKEKGQGLFLGRERKNDEAAEKEVREIEFLPTSTSHPDESEFATTAGLTSFSSSAGGGCGVPLDLSLRL
ncbi:hypothetical protein E2562_029853 [Oryza meyeriana var. granulata]|uniref:Uncharacterized protein n=1 Tax=Oryza meyeriana var. granulata TaxID=110450 RepID=A0A6G1ER81_9ORYZ|nr:hypothetical protein E2562_029853 [Oryza meyeriana var. granulata]